MCVTHTRAALIKRARAVLAIYAIRAVCRDYGDASIDYAHLSDFPFPLYNVPCVPVWPAPLIWPRRAFSTFVNVKKNCKKKPIAVLPVFLGLCTYF